MTDDICGAETSSTDGVCQHPAGSCPVASHSDADAENNQGRPTAITEEVQESIYNAVELGLTVKHQAAIAGVHPDTLRRAACCVETLREPELTTDDPCEFCEGYVRAHGEGAANVLGETSAEFRASATFGYTKSEERQITGEGGGPLEVNFSEEIVETPWSEGDQE